MDVTNCRISLLNHLPSLHDQFSWSLGTQAEVPNVLLENKIPDSNSTEGLSSKSSTDFKRKRTTIERKEEDGLHVERNSIAGGRHAVTSLPGAPGAGNGLGPALPISGTPLKRLHLAHLRSSEEMRGSYLSKRGVGYSVSPSLNARGCSPSFKF
ncbi:hypothetical protein J6590_029635 [Homalodisca vitripennis]|nr:hypothetical protein J6590_029635 [Homalodisca vitripennis]